MSAPNERTHRVARRSRFAGRVLAAALLAGSAACARDQPLGPGRAAPERPSATLNPACDPGLGGLTHVDSVTAAETWSRAGNPHHVDQIIHVEGAGVLTLAPGVLVCFGSAGALDAANGGRLVADGLDTARIVLTAADPANGWGGVHLRGTPASASSLKNATVEHTRADYALSTHDYHAAAIDSVTVRQNERGLYLWGRVTSLRRSRVDTVTSASYPAVTLGSHVIFEQSVVRGAAGVGLAVLGTNGISLLGGRIEGSGGVGLKVTTTGPGFVTTQPVRVVGGASYPAELVVSAFPRIYTSVAQQDSLLGNARDTLVVTGGILQAWAFPAPALPWIVTADIVVQYFGILHPEPGASLAFQRDVGITARNGGRVVARGTAAAPVLFTAADFPGNASIDRWDGITFEGAPALASYLTNVRIELVLLGTAVLARDQHPVVIDSSVFRQNGSAVVLESSNSRLSRSRVDTTSSLGYAVRIDVGTLESTLIRGSAGVGLVVGSNLAQVLSCEVRESAGNGIELWAGGEVHNCNLVGNGGAGVYAANLNSVNAENNWWGDAAGPTGPNGDGVSGPVDYTPWLLSSYVLPYVP